MLSWLTLELSSSSQLNGSILPSPEEVHRDRSHVFVDADSVKVKLLSSGIIVKYGSTRLIQLDEGLAMQLAREHGITEAPKVSCSSARITSTLADIPFWTVHRLLHSRQRGLPLHELH